MYETTVTLTIPVIFFTCMQVVATVRYIQDEKERKRADPSRMSCAPNIRSLRLDENIVSLERTIYVARLRNDICGTVT